MSFVNNFIYGLHIPTHHGCRSNQTYGSIGHFYRQNENMGVFVLATSFSGLDCFISLIGKADLFGSLYQYSPHWNGQQSIMAILFNLIISTKVHVIAIDSGAFLVWRLFIPFEYPFSNMFPGQEAYRVHQSLWTSI
jgi:hypothetical protein